MLALSITQPWATLIAIGAKRIETRSWSSRYRGPIAIHAAKGFPSWAKELCEENAYYREALGRIGIHSRKDLDRLPRGAIIATCDLAQILSTNGGLFKMTAADIEIENGVVKSGVAASVNYQKPATYTAEWHFGDYSPNRYMWFLETVRALPKPILCKGALSLWQVPVEVEAQIRSQIKTR